MGGGSVLVQALQGSNLEERLVHLHRLMNEARTEVLKAYQEKLDLSWVYHDSALEGTVYGQQELLLAFHNQPVEDAALIPVIDEIRQHKAALEAARELSKKKRVVINMDVVKQIYACLAPDETEGKGGPKYRKDMPVHRLYFHDIVAPDKIALRVRQFLDWMNDPETVRSMHVLRLAAKAQHQLMQIYPFPKHSGKVARLLMNIILMHNGYPPAIIHSTERQRYYEALRGPDHTSAPMVHEAMVSSVESAVRYFEAEKINRIAVSSFRRRRAISG